FTPSLQLSPVELLVPASFPTRRSSDLERQFSGIRNQTNTGVFGATLTDGNHVLDLVFSDAVTQQTVRVFAENTTVTLPKNPDGIDRKSTRLNSSQGSISYAVIFLYNIQ